MSVVGLGVGRVPGVVLGEVIEESAGLVRYAAKGELGGEALVVSVVRAEAGVRARLAQEAMTLRRLAGMGIEPVRAAGSGDEGVYVVTAPSLCGSGAAVAAAGLETDGGRWGERLVKETGLDVSSAWGPVRAALEDSVLGRYRAVAAWVAELADGVDALHQAGVPHGRLDLSAVKLCPQGRMHLAADMVLIARADPQERRLEPPRVAPEWLAAGAGGARLSMASRREADVWGLGAMLLELLTGHAPYASGGPAGWMALATTEAAAPTAYLDDVPVEINTVCRSALSRNPAARPRSAAALAGMLRSTVGLGGR